MQALSGIGLVIFTALDFGLGEDQERALSIDLETLLDLLASEGTIFYLAHVIEQPNLRIPNPQYLKLNFCFDFFNDSENIF